MDSELEGNIEVRAEEGGRPMKQNFEVEKDQAETCQ